MDVSLSFLVLNLISHRFGVCFFNVHCSVMVNLELLNIDSHERAPIVFTAEILPGNISFAQAFRPTTEALSGSPSYRVDQKFLPPGVPASSDYAFNKGLRFPFFPTISLSVSSSGDRPLQDGVSNGVGQKGNLACRTCPARRDQLLLVPLLPVRTEAEIQKVQERYNEIFACRAHPEARSYPQEATALRARTGITPASVRCSVSLYTRSVFTDKMCRFCFCV